INVSETLKYPSENINNNSLSVKHGLKNSCQSSNESSSFKLKNHQFFHRFLKYSSKFGGFTKSENNSPLLLSSPIHPNPQSFKNAYTTRYGAWNPVSD
ncbi:unnamed protein product, partial [Schistosoma margrebowiei]